MSRFSCLTAFLFILCLFNSIVCNVSGQPVFDITAFGAVAGVNTDAQAELNTGAIIQAFDAATNGARNHRMEKHSAANFWDNVHSFSARSDADDFDASSEVSSINAATSTVLIPADGVFYITYTPIQNMSNVLLMINGTLRLNGNETRWQELAPPGYYGALHFIDCQQITIQGKMQSFGNEEQVDYEEMMVDTSALHPAVSDLSIGSAKALSRATGSPLPTSPVDVDGAGYAWWWTVLLGPLDHRPHMFYFVRCSGVILYGLFIQNSPMFHVLFEDSENVYVKNMTIYVDVEGQKTLGQRADEHKGVMSISDPSMPFQLPTFPLNTDGVDPAVQGLLMEDFYVENYDDAVAVKPCNGGGQICQCASNMLVRNGHVRFSVGMTIGSVPPHENQNCVANITYMDVHMRTPFKAIYIKTNPGIVGTGLIENITYDNIAITTPLWYPIWIGPQQQKQPAHGTNTGCSFFYPLNQTCETQPLVTINGVTLSNIESTGGLTLPGVLLCDPSNPCTNIQWDSVSNSGPFLVSKNYVCLNAQGGQNGSQPEMGCLQAW